MQSVVPLEPYCEPIDLTPKQDERLMRAIAICNAKRAALAAGMTVEAVQATEWIVDIHPVPDAL